jgi:opacity protein-like surface antigen
MCKYRLFSKGWRSYTEIIPVEWSVAWLFLRSRLQSVLRGIAHEETYTMNRYTPLKCLSAVLALVLGAQRVMAADAGAFYIGADISATQFMGDGPAKSVVFVDGQKFKDSDSSFGIHAGFQFIDWFAVELAYTDFGSATDRFKISPDIAFIVSPNRIQTIAAKGASLAGVFSYGLGADFAIFGILGVAVMDYEKTLSGGFSPVRGSLLERDSLSDQGLVYGVGAKYALSQSFGLRVDLRRNDVGDFSLDTASVGVEYSF